MLARPEQNQGGADRRLVAASGGVAHARDKTAPAFVVANTVHATTAIAPAANHAFREQSVPSVMKRAPTDARPA